MPSTLPSSFASAAAGNSADHQARGAAAASNNNTSRGDASYAEWSRRPNGATQTFRRSSSVMNNAPSSHSRESSVTLPPAASAYVPPHLAHGRNGVSIDTRYSKAQLLDLFKDQRDSGDIDDGLSDLFVGDWDPGFANGGGSGSKWTRGQDASTDLAAGPDICFDRSHDLSLPAGLFDLSYDERELFTSSVNSTLKGPTQGAGPREGPAARKISLSTGTQPLNSPTATRPMNRRRETTESQSITSPKVGRDDNAPSSPPPSLVRRRTDLRDAASDDRSRDPGNGGGAGSVSAIGTLKRASTQPFGGSGSTPSSPWAAAPPGGAMGSFGNFSMGNAAAARPALGGRGESRFRGLMNRDSAEEIGTRSSMNSLGRLDEGMGGSMDDQEGFPGEGVPVGSAALGGDSPPPGGGAYHDYATPARQRPGLDSGLSGLSGQGHGPNSGFAGQFSHPASSQPQHSQPHAEPMSPTYTNPYQSPENSKHQRPDDNESEEPQESNSFHLPGLGGYRQDGSGGGGGGGNNPSAFNARMASASFGDMQGYERGASSAVGGGSRGFPGLGPLGGLAGLGGQDPSLRSPATMHSPALAGLGGANFNQPSAPGSQTGSIGRGNSRLGSLFPSGMQDQMRTRPMDTQSEDTDENSSFAPGAGAFGQGQAPHRDTESPFRTGRGKFEDFFAPGDKQDPSLDAFVRAQMGGQGLGAPGQPAVHRMPSNVGSTGSSQPPAPQQKTMVMPDRIRWIYRDPQGNTQGPWSGLEMHDWYRAGFFSPELLVKKVEDPDYEPLAQLIRRIGNSREPFLVPQIGIPGPPSSQAGWPNQHPAPGPSNPGTQPPFAGSFPSFGTTLTAEQQNALERRKQEEQYLMARQKEHLAQQQFLVKQLQMQGQFSGYPNSGLQHHSSANSLHSQPSYGSITSPSGFQPTPMAAPGPLNQAPASASGFPQGFDSSSFRGIGAIGSGLDSLGNIKEEDLPGLMSRLGVSGPPGAGGTPTATGGSSQESMNHSSSAAFAERARLQQEAAEYAAHEEEMLSLTHGDDQRLKQFQALQQDQIHAELKHEDDLSHEPHDDDDYDDIAETVPEDDEAMSSAAGEARDLTLTEQVQKAASAKQSPAHVPGPWGSSRADHDAPTNVAPPQSSSPLPAPAARRKHGNMADQLHVESVAQSGSPSIETPTTSVAPWAQQAAEAQKQPSLKEIQEAEARTAAKQEEINQAARRAALERELAANQAAAAASAPGLPSSSTWGSGSVEPSPTTTNAPWAKMTTGGKVTPSTAARKTLQQIQKEEEARKQKAMAAAAISMPTPSVASAAQLAASKRYADLTGKSASPVSAAMAAAGTTTATGAAGSGAWTTVGAGGKAKPPPAPAGPGMVLQRTASANLGRSASGSGPAPVKPAAPSRANTIANTPASAMENLRKWAVAELRPDLNKGLTPEGFVSDLLNLGTDTGLITEAVHQSSQTMDSRHFAEEFVRRRILADKGKTVDVGAPAAAAASSAGGWSEVARKGPAKTGTGLADEADAAFKVVAAKKKGGRK